MLVVRLLEAKVGPEVHVVIDAGITSPLQSLQGPVGLIDAVPGAAGDILSAHEDTAALEEGGDVCDWVGFFLLHGRLSLVWFPSPTAGFKKQNLGPEVQIEFRILILSSLAKYVNPHTNCRQTSFKTRGRVDKWLWGSIP